MTENTYFFHRGFYHTANKTYTYTIKKQPRRAVKKSEKFRKNFVKRLDNHAMAWYNVDTLKERRTHDGKQKEKR